MNLRRSVLLLILFNILAVAIALLLPVDRILREPARRDICAENLMLLWKALRSYEIEHKRLPLNLSQLYYKYISEKSSLHCPNDPIKGRNSYQLFYIPCDPKDEANHILAGCGFHPQGSQLLLYFGGLLQPMEFIDASLYSVKGDIRVKRINVGKWRKGYLYMRLQNGDSLKANKNSSCVLKWQGSNSFLRVLPDSQITNKLTVKRASSGQTSGGCWINSVELKYGSLWVDAANKDFADRGAYFVVVTKFGLLETTGASLSVSQAPKQLQVFVAKGDAYFKSQGCWKKITAKRTFTVRAR